MDAHTSKGAVFGGDDIMHTILGNLAHVCVHDDPKRFKDAFHATIRSIVALTRVSKWIVLGEAEYRVIAIAIGLGIPVPPPQSYKSYVLCQLETLYKLASTPHKLDFDVYLLRNGHFQLHKRTPFRSNFDALFCVFDDIETDDARSRAHLAAQHMKNVVPSCAWQRGRFALSGRSFQDTVVLLEM